MDYLQFLNQKTDSFQFHPIEHGELHPILKPFQKDCVEFALARGRAALFADTGLGKTVMQCEWARHIPGKVLFLAPLAVADQTITEADTLLDMDIFYSSDGTAPNQFTITNYEHLHKFNPEDFTAVVLDESSILKSFMGKTKQLLVDSFANTPYRLACTATPAPNDHMELGNHSEFLGIMPGTEMLSRWFINDPANVGKYRLKGHAIKSFWQWVGTWAACISKPSDYGYPNEGYDLPPLNLETHIIETDLRPGTDGELFDTSKYGTASALELHKWKRLSTQDRIDAVAELVNNSKDTWLVWCETNEESKLLSQAIPDSVEVKGSDSSITKRANILAFLGGTARVLVSKPSICGFGLNMQHCHHIAFASISYSYEKFYQAIRRSWRFGQQHPVACHVMVADSEISVWRNIESKANAHDRMKHNMRHAILAAQGKAINATPYTAHNTAHLPKWLTTKTA